MKKQTTYSKLIPRLFATTVDLFLLSFLSTPVMNLISARIFKIVFNDFFLSSGVDLNNSDALMVAIRAPEFGQYVTFGNFLTYFGSLMLINAIIFGCFFIGFWVKVGATPGKYIMRLRVADADTFERPTLLQGIKRFLSYPTGLLGVFLVVFTKQRQAWHDKVASTVVLKV